jgi:hypothetical protein
MDGLAAEMGRLRWGLIGWGLRMGGGGVAMRVGGRGTRRGRGRRMRGRGLALDEDHAVWIVYDIRGWGAALGYYKG